MPLLSATELSQLRADIADLLPDTCVILTPTVNNNYGDSDVTWGTAVASAACRFDPDTSPITGEVADRDAMLSRFIVTLAYNESVSAGDRLVYSGGTYEMTGLYGEHSARGAKRLKVTLLR